MTRWIIILALTIVALISCSKMQPAGFWTDFDKDMQTEQINDQGPWGGHLALYWSSNEKGFFDTRRVINFATNNGWTLVDSTEYTADIIKNWTHLTKPIFPLANTGFDPKVTSSVSTYEDFPRWTMSDALVFHFKTGWVSIQPGTNDSYETNGFVMINKDQSEMTVYHLWGE